jgi:myo-inositol-1-phosphate synthase
MRGMSNVRVAIIGVGHCASALVQGMSYYRHAADDDRAPSPMHLSLGGYHIDDSEFAAAFDVDANKVGQQDLSAAIFAPPARRCALPRCRPWACRFGTA